MPKRMLEIRRNPDLGEEPLDPDDRGQLGSQDFEGNFAIVPEVVGQVDRGHATLSQLAVEPVPVTERRAKPFEPVGHGVLDMEAPPANARGRAPKEPTRPVARRLASPP